MRRTRSFQSPDRANIYNENSEASKNKLVFLRWRLLSRLDDGTCDYPAKSSSITSSSPLSSSGSRSGGSARLPSFPYPIRFFRRLLYILRARYPAPAQFYSLRDTFRSVPSSYFHHFSHITGINHYTCTSPFLVFSSWTAMSDHLSCPFSSSQPLVRLFPYLSLSLSLPYQSPPLYQFLSRTFITVTRRVFIFLTRVTNLNFFSKFSFKLSFLF